MLLKQISQANALHQLLTNTQFNWFELYTHMYNIRDHEYYKLIKTLINM